MQKLNQMIVNDIIDIKDVYLYLIENSSVLIIHDHNRYSIVNFSSKKITQFKLKNISKN